MKSPSRHARLGLGSLLLGGALALALSSCASSPSRAHEHWSTHSISPRVARNFLGYEPDEDGSYLDFQWQKKQDINLTTKRHFFNWNPENPFQAPDPDMYRKRPVHSALPYTHHYVHLEGLVFAALTDAAGGAVVPIPVDSIIATFSDDGPREFVEGVQYSFTPMGRLSSSFIHRTIGRGGPLQAAWVHPPE